MFSSNKCWWRLPPIFLFWNALVWLFACTLLVGLVATMCISLGWLKTWENCGNMGWMCWMGISSRPSGYVQWCFVPLITFQLMGIWVGIVSKDITHVLYVRETQASSNSNMARRQYILGTEDFLNLITRTDYWRKLLMKARRIKVLLDH